MIEIRPAADAAAVNPTTIAVASRLFSMVFMYIPPMITRCCCQSPGSLPLGRIGRFGLPPFLRSRLATRSAWELAAAAILNGIEQHGEHDDGAGEHCLPVG